MSPIRLSKSNDSIATTPIPEKNPPVQTPHKHRTSIAFETIERYTVSELIAKLGVKRQAIEDRRDKGTLSEIGYRAEQTGRNWFYYPVKKDLTAIDGDNEPKKP